MPVYCYTRNGKSRWIKMTTKEYSSLPNNQEIEIDGERWARDMSADVRGYSDDGTQAPHDPDYHERVRVRKSIWPIHSDAFQVPASEIGVHAAHAAEHGVPTDFDKEGKPIFTSNRHKNEYHKIVGAHTPNGDVAPDQGLLPYRPPQVDREAVRRKQEALRQFCWEVDDKYRHKRFRR